MLASTAEISTNVQDPAELAAVEETVSEAETTNAADSEATEAAPAAD